MRTRTRIRTIRTPWISSAALRSRGLFKVNVFPCLGTAGWLACFYSVATKRGKRNPFNFRHHTAVPPLSLLHGLPWNATSSASPPTPFAALYRATYHRLNDPVVASGFVRASRIPLSTSSPRAQLVHLPDRFRVHCMRRVRCIRLVFLPGVAWDDAILRLWPRVARKPKETVTSKSQGDFPRVRASFGVCPRFF